MNKLIQMTKIMALCLIAASIFSSCSKESGTTQHSERSCDHVTINITSNLKKEVTDLEVNGEVIGELPSESTIEDICFDQLATDSGVYPYISIKGTYKGETFNIGLGFCGVGLTMEESGTFSVELMQTDDGHFYYQNL